jgi:hypothetical protein
MLRPRPSMVMFSAWRDQLPGQLPSHGMPPNQFLTRQRLWWMVPKFIDGRDSKSARRELSRNTAMTSFTNAATDTCPPTPVHADSAAAEPAGEFGRRRDVPATVAAWELRRCGDALRNPVGRHTVLGQCWISDVAGVSLHPSPFRTLTTAWPRRRPTHESACNTNASLPCLTQLLTGKIDAHHNNCPGGGSSCGTWRTWGWRTRT